ncbi:MAG TPA: sn-glycerol-3-phosphate ABC transporter ATP-binding protein UgpC [Acidimicrobiales bacterium]|nr:sn-glycerol-3-phosphate ABC transporter ATP-binding protein UgpC [Acidimicrobiales bacterium]
MATVVLDSVNKKYENGFHAVHDLDLDIEDGEFLVLVGPSGCGKSTALRMVAGLESISAGTLTIGDRVVNDVHPKDRDIAFVFQNYALYPHMTVRDNIGFALKLRRTPKDEIDKRVGEAARLLELTSYLDRKPGQLSGGQRQRVAMGRAIVRRPQVFLMDEPLSNLDAKLRVQMRAEISRLQHNLGVTTIYVTHDQVEAMTMGDRVAVLSDGYLQQIDTPQNLYDSPDNLFVATFIGSPQMNLVLGAVDATEEDGVGITIGSQRLSVPASRLLESPALRTFAGRDVIVGIRPEILEDAEVAGNDGRVVTAALPVRVLLREGLGSEVVVHAELDARAPAVKTAQGENTILNEGGGVGIIARLDPRTTVALDAPATFTVELERLHFFDPETGLAIRG